MFRCGFQTDIWRQVVKVILRQILRQTWRLTWRLTSSLSLATGLLVLPALMFAHHSAAGLFDPKVQKTLKGTVKELRLVNPHASLVIETKDSAGHVDTWTLQFPSPRQLMREHGWNRNTLKPGDEVTIIGNPFFNEKKIMFPNKVTLSDGKEYTIRERFDEVGGRGGSSDYQVE
jgi:hypothetical protein